MNDRSERISSLIASLESRVSYIRAKVTVLVPSQIRSLRLKSNMPRQSDLAQAADLHQSRISKFETPGENVTVDTLCRLAAALNVGLLIKFVSFSEMLRWENDYSQDAFNVTRLADDTDFLYPATTVVRKRVRWKRNARRVLSIGQTPATATAVGARQYMNASQGGRSQMRLPFDLAEQADHAVTQEQLADVLKWPDQSAGANLNRLTTTSANAGAGARRYYANR